MTFKKLKQILDGTGYPVAYRAFTEPQVLPVICYLETSSDNFGADNIVFQPITNMAVELYTKTKDLSAEAKVEKALEDAGIFWESQETYLADEKCYEKIYSFQITGGKANA